MLAVFQHVGGERSKRIRDGAAQCCALDLEEFEGPEVVCRQRATQAGAAHMRKPLQTQEANLRRQGAIHAKWAR